MSVSISCSLLIGSLIDEENFKLLRFSQQFVELVYETYVVGPMLSLLKPPSFLHFLDVVIKMVSELLQAPK